MNLRLSRNPGSRLSREGDRRRSAPHKLQEKKLKKKRPDVEETGQDNEYGEPPEKKGVSVSLVQAYTINFRQGVILKHMMGIPERLPS